MGCFTRVLLSLLLGCVLVLAINAVFNPWSFFMGGRFHLIPMWRGWGRMHSSVAGGDYLLFISMSPHTGRGRGLSHVTGSAVLCTPRGETFNLTLGGDFEKHMGASTDGKRAYFYMHKRTGFFSSSTDTHPDLDFYGAWHNPELVLDDHGMLSREFNPDGSLYSSSLSKRPPAHETVSLTLHEGSRSEFDAACKAITGH